MAEKVKLMREQWDYLIILDACRYDYFEQVWGNYLKGDLTKKISVGSGTVEWRNKSFTSYYGDVIYISANPYITSSGPVKGFSAKQHFCKVYCLCLNDWDKQKGTVLPETVTKRAIDIINANTDKRAIIHYLQPHEPYLGSAVTSPGYTKPEPGVFLPDGYENNAKFKIANNLLKILSGILYWLGIRGRFLPWKLREILAMPPANPMDVIRRKYGKEILRKAYKENLEIALKHVVDLVNSLSGRIVITADHGEILGENECYGHWSRSSNKFLVEIPWLVIDKGESVTEPADQITNKGQRKPQPSGPADEEADEEAKRKIQERLKSLGYY